MDVERLQELAKQYPEVQELLKDNYSLSVVLLQQRIHDQDIRLTKVEDTLNKVIDGCRELKARVEAMEAKQ